MLSYKKHSIICYRSHDRMKILTQYWTRLKPARAVRLQTVGEQNILQNSILLPSKNPLLEVLILFVSNKTELNLSFTVGLRLLRFWLVWFFNQISILPKNQAALDHFAYSNPTLMYFSCVSNVGLVHLESDKQSAMTCNATDGVGRYSGNFRD